MGSGSTSGATLRNQAVASSVKIVLFVIELILMTADLLPNPGATTYTFPLPVRGLTER